jgi:hypothetical protein
MVSEADERAQDFQKMSDQDISYLAAHVMFPWCVYTLSKAEFIKAFITTPILLFGCTDTDSYIMEVAQNED